ncbi:MAG: alpha/beta hydrolase [Asgard group archaeon]|nr:alpha/beta hydrolase [Asgard group archaeon]
MSSKKTAQNKVMNIQIIALTVVILCSLMVLSEFLAIIITIDNSSTTPIIEPNPNRDQNVPGLFYSELVDDNFKIYLSLPDSYNESDDQRYPVIYLLDADWHFDGSDWHLSEGGVKGIIKQLYNEGKMPEAILVGIGYPETNYRNRDFLYPSDYMSPNSGGAPNFYSFLKLEFLPYIDLNYKTNITFGRTLIGDSYGGYFTLFTITHYGTNTTNLFTNFICISPTVAYHDYYILTQEEELYNRTNGILPMRLHLSIGSDEWAEMLEGVSILNQTIITRNYSDLLFHHQIFEGYNHISVVGPAVTQGLTWLFSYY